ncbi:MAG: carbamoyltransferase HypF [Spirochaetales bacterium]|nr:carbamoyltransferase HypF [Spirochaetales bacterium]
MAAWTEAVNAVYCEFAAMITKRIIVKGVVQGVGFRPFVYNRAAGLGIMGTVANTTRCVEILAQGTEEAVAALERAVRETPPPQSRVESVESVTVENPPVFDGFTIEESRADDVRIVRISRDLALCPDCRRELFDPRDRRFFYPYINCTNCGPRFTIVRDIPYDRANTTMSSFPMCPECEREYSDPADRRFHAQPNACHVCGPHVSLCDRNGVTIVRGVDSSSVKDLIERTAAMLSGGAIIAVKGLGGFHIACRADDEKTVAALRWRKRREEKPLAVMVRDIESARRLVELGETEERRLLDVDAPIMLLPKKPGHGLAEAVAPRSSTLGLMLPYTPLQHLLFSRIDVPLVMTSANFSDEPIACRNDEALHRLSPICDYFLQGDRDIQTRADDSVVRLFRGGDYPIRRARGFTPSPVVMRTALKRPVLAVGAELKNTVCLAHGDSAFLSQHVGDLKDRETYRAFLDAIRHFLALLDVTPSLIAHDLHPQYLSTQFALDPPPDFEWAAAALKFPVQHHHAHIASCMAERGLRGPVIGVALDGTGLGTDGTVWGGEILVADRARFERRAHLGTVAMPGGDLAVREPWRMAAACLREACGNGWRDVLPPSLSGIPEQKLAVTAAQLESSLSLPVTSSCGRLFDAMSAISGVCLEARYEGQPAIEFEQAFAGNGSGDENGYRFSIEEKSDGIVIDWRGVVLSAAMDARKRTSSATISGKFHRGLADVLASTVSTVARKTGLKDVVLSGGCFMNMTLLEGLALRIEHNGLKPIVHERVPCNDGGLALGQAVVAAENVG